MPIDRNVGLREIGKALRKELAQEHPPLRPEIERALRRVLERDVAERSRPQQTWAGKNRK
jgi:hypothetical protein